MESTSNETDVLFRQMATYNCNLPIKITYVFEDSDQDDVDAVNNSPALENGVCSASATESLPSSNQYCHSHDSDNDNVDNSFNIEDEVRSSESNDNKSKEHMGESVHSHTVSSFTIPQTNSPQMNNTPNKMPSFMSLLTSNQKSDIMNLLNTVSKNLINISKCYHYYNEQYLKDERRDIKTRRKYTLYKNYFFSKCYNISVTLFLPQEYNNNFIQKFINRTIALANSMFWYRISSIQLKYLIGDMIFWTKQRMKYLEASGSYTQLQKSMKTPCPTPTFSPQLSPTLPPILSPLNSTSNVNWNESVSAEHHNSMNQSTNQMKNYMEASSHILQQPVNRLPPTPPQPSTFPPSRSTSTSNVNWNERISIGNRTSMCQSTEQNKSYQEARGHQLQQQLSSLPPISSQPTIPLSSNSISNANLNEGIPTKDSVYQCINQGKKYLEASCHQYQQPIDRPSKIPFVPALQPLMTPSSCSTNEKYANEKTSAEDINCICLFSNGPSGREINISIDPATLKENQIMFNENSNVATTNDVNVRKRVVDNCSCKQMNKRPKTFDDIGNYSIDTCYPGPNQANYNPNLSANISNIVSNNNTVMPPHNSLTNKCFPASRQIVDQEQKNNEYQTSLSRSVSRDSGFSSPVSIYNDNNTAYPHRENNPLSEVQISHITSLNPNAVQIANGPCRICGSSTRTMCIGCYQEYYCSTTCQKAHWPFHKNKCKIR